MTEWMLITGCGLVLVLPVAWRIARRSFDPFEPIVFFAFAYAAMFVVRPAAMLLEHEMTFWGLDVRPKLPHAILLALVGAVAFVSGYELRVARSLALRLPSPRPLETRPATVAALGVAAVALAAWVIFLPTSDGVESLRLLLEGRSAELAELLQSSSTYVWYGSLLFAPAGVVLVALALRERSAPLGVLAAAVVALALLRTLPVGGRIVLLPMVGGIFVVAYVMRDRRPSARMLAAVAVLSLFGSYFLLHTRDPTDQLTARSAIQELAEQPQDVLDPVLHGADAEMVLALSAALTVVPEELPHRWGGATIGNLATRPIPRELWSGKPRPPGETVVATVWPSLYPGLDPAFSPLLALYWDFGIPGIALGMALFGIAARTLYEWFLRHRRSLVAQLTFAIGVWFVVIGSRNDPVDTIVFAAFLLAPALVIAAIGSSRIATARSRSIRQARVS
ncbi:MAG: O-antigen polymerase [Gaiellaceae bacterium]